jgi:hypothetical protein
MFDSEYFREHLFAQIEKLGASACSVTVHLTDQTVLTVKRVIPDDAKPGYVLLEVYPPEGVNEESTAKRKKPWRTDEVLDDRVAVAYEHIMRVSLTIVPPNVDEASRFIGFPT